MAHCLPSSYAFIFFWGIVVVLGFVGLGRLIALWVCGVERKAGWGLHAVWGMSAFLFLGGMLGIFHACDEIGITLLLAVGLVAWVWTTCRAGLPSRAEFMAKPWSAWPVFVALALLYSAWLFKAEDVHPFDDLAAYFNFDEKLLATGSFDEPFSWRRLASLGGHTLLQCSMLAWGSWANTRAFEGAICPVIIAGLILGFRQGALGRSLLGLLLTMIAITTPMLRANTTSYLTGVTLFLGLFVTLDLAEREIAPRRRWLAVAGLVAAGLSSLRASYIPAACATLGFFWIASWVLGKISWRETLAEAAHSASGMLAGLFPWMLMGFLSNGSPLFPFLKGDSNPDFLPQSLGEPPQVRVLLVLQMLLHPALITLSLSLMASLPWRFGIAARSATFAGVLGSAAIAYSITTGPDSMTVPRYAQPMLLTAALAALMSGAASLRGRRAAWAFAILIAATSLPARGELLWNCCEELAHLSPEKLPFSFHGRASDFRKAQDLVPRGKRILVCSDDSFLFDFRRNPIWIIDFPNAASPPPGLPFHKPAGEMKRYLQKTGVDYVIFVDPAESEILYKRAFWQKQAKNENPFWAVQAPFYLDFFDAMENLAATEPVLGKPGNLTVLQLQP